MAVRAGSGRGPRRRELAALHPALRGRRRRDRADRVDGQARAARRPAAEAGRRGLMRTPPRANPAAVHAAVRFLPRQNRSEEHTSELQSLMRISYAVFCLKKKTHTHSYKTRKET